MSEKTANRTPLLDEWRAEVGDEAVAAAVQAARAQIASSSNTFGALTAARRDLASLPDRLVSTRPRCAHACGSLCHPEELFAWVPDGPPRTKRSVVAGIELFEDQLPSGISDWRGGPDPSSRGVARWARQMEARSSDVL